MISRLLKITCLFCKRALYKRLYSAKETYDFKEPTNRIHPTDESFMPISAVVLPCEYIYIHVYMPCIYIYIYIYIYIHICMYTRICIHLYTLAHTYVQIISSTRVPHAHISNRTSMYTNMYTYIYVYIYICMHI